MGRRQILSLMVVGAMAFTMTACGGSNSTSSSASSAKASSGAVSSATGASSSTSTAAASSSQVVSETSTEETPAVAASIDFEDGNFGFVGIDKVVNRAADDSTFEVADFNGSKALKVTPTGTGSIDVAIQADALLGADAGKLKTVEMSAGIENPDGKFSAVSGNIYGLVGENKDQTQDAWSVYLETANPKTITYTVPDGYTFGEGNYLVVSVESDVAKDAGGTPAILYLDDITFKDADGNVLKADSTAQFASQDTGNDRSNLFALTSPTEIEGFQVSADAWAQAGIDLTEDQIKAIDKNTVFEISYTSETGNMWLVFPGAEKGWMRIGVGDADGSGQGYAYLNSSKNIAQVDFKTISKYLGKDPTKWGTTLQCESDGKWEVYSVKMGKKAKHYTLNGGVSIEGFQKKADGWAQDGVEVSEDVMKTLVPGTAIEIDYTSETGEIWLVFPGAEKGWMRIGVGDYDGSGQGYGIFDGSKCFITYETIAKYLGEDTSKWGTTIQCEASSAWEVFDVKIGKAVVMKANNRQTEVEGFATSADGWAQAGADLTEDQIKALVPGSVININYTSESGEIWLVFPGAEKGWMRIGVGNFDGSGQGFAAYDGSHAQVTYETIAKYLGDDTSKWGTTLQCEASTAWEVYGINIGQTK